MADIISNDAVREIITIASQQGILSQKDVDNTIAHSNETGKPMSAILFERNLMDEQSLASFIASSYGLQLTEIDPEGINDEAVKKLTPEYMENNMIFPFQVIGSTLSIAICDQTKLSYEKNLKVMTGMNIDMILVTQSNLQKLFEKAGMAPDAGGEVVALGSLRKQKEEAAPEVEITERDRTEAEQFVTSILLDAYKRNVSDMHIESFRTKKQLRFRIDGVLQVQDQYSEEINQRYLATVSILKLLSGARIEEKRMPQDGAIAFSHNKIEFDLRVSFLPVQGGQERVVMRLLRKDSIKLDLADMGFKPDELEKINDAIYATQGLVLVTGPTGSGKTTTLYSILSELNDPKRNILTAEDPIEYELEGIGQSQMKSEINYTFAKALRTFLRQDPEVILVGEIRDQETGNIAVEAALTGHLVCSTLHTNSSVETITRLVNMGIPNYLISSSVSLVIGQRLARKVCQECKVEDKNASSKLLKQMKLPSDLKCFVGKGCKACNNSGYKGRQGIYEILKVTEELQDGILKNLTIPEMEKVAKKEGFQSMQEVGAGYINDGVLSLEEYQRTLFIS
tara:strand:+ start:383 stop:2086 length:1704 start_codon:yes stop_codon:yes gene_type:complete